MKVKSILLGVALVALMASCGSKNTTETSTDTPAETPMEENMTDAPEQVQAEQVQANAPATTGAKTTANQAQQAPAAQAPVVDPCEEKVKAFERYVDQLKAAKKAKGNGANELKAYADLKKQATAMENTIKECQSNPDYKTRLTNAIMAEKTARN